LQGKNGPVGYAFWDIEDEDGEENFIIKDIAVLPNERSKSLDLIRATIKKCESFSKIWEFEVRDLGIYKLLNYFERQKRITILNPEELKNKDLKEGDYPEIRFEILPEKLENVQ
jgi:hypothetical protein